MINNKGETLVETLVAFLILTIVVVGFSNVIATTAKLNKTVKDKRNTINNSTVSYIQDCYVSIDNDRKYTVKLYYDSSSELYYYESK